MDHFHLTVKMHGRQGGKRAAQRAAKGRARTSIESAVGAAAYRSGEVLYDERTGTTYRYGGADRVKHTEIIAPADAPAWVYDRAQLWNSVEQREKRKDSQLMREIEVALPAVLSHEQQVELVRGFIVAELTPHGIVADAAIHRPDRNKRRKRRSHLNDHCHISSTLRGITPDGWTAQKLRHLEDHSTVDRWRAAWAEHTNRALERAGRPERVDHRSYAEQDADLPVELRREPMLKVGPGGQGKNRDQENERIRERNAARIEAAAIYRAERDQAANAVRGITHPEPTIPVPAPQPEPMRTPVEVAPAPAPGPTPAPVIAASEVARERTPKRPPAPAPRPESAKKPQKTPIVRQILTVIGDFADDPLGIKRRRAHKRKDAEVKRAQTIAHNKKIYEAWTRRIKSDPDMIAGDLHWAIAGRSAFADVFDHKALGLPATTSDAMRKRICEFAMDVKSERERAEYVARGRASSAPEPSRMQEIKWTRSRDTSALGDEWWLSNKSGPER